MEPPINTGCPEARSSLRQLRVTGTEGPRCALTVHVKLASPALDYVALDFAGVVGDVVEQLEIRFGDALGEDLAREVGQDLPVCQRTVDGRAHGPQVALADLGADRGAGQLPVRQIDAVSCRDHHHFAQELGADLMAEAARAAMDRHHHLALDQPEGLRRSGVKDLGHVLDLQVMIARP